VGGTTAFELLRPGALDASSEVHHAAAAGHGEEAAPVGKRMAMIVDIRKCIEQKGCQDCINACHSTHNVPTIDSLKEEVKWMWKEKFEHAFPSQTHEYIDEPLQKGVFPILCNHCDDPPCVRVCPTKATFRRDDGIVMMDMHRCIGCRFCMAGCPYGARSFNWRDPRGYFAGKEDTMNPEYPTRTRGVVEKCTFCTERLAIGLEPACVEACKKRGDKGGALTFGDLNDPDSEIRRILRTTKTIRRKAELGTKPSVFFIV
jgi:molybdopterin-containing oxidoreductase family iron-sulfur binding subunit